ncbi:hypothetical protein, partial [Phenylobacterium sp.]|uniref:hypothetical protein n=1 Tax=Phenylobacterium sp. TaxID=1871053 RepID=UPI002F3F8B9A
MDRFPGARRLNRSGLFLAASAASLCLPIAAFAQTNVTIGGGTATGGATGGASNNTTSGVVIGDRALLQSDSGPLGDMPDVVIGAGAVSTGSQAILGPTGVVIGGGPNTVVGAAAEALNAT